MGHVLMDNRSKLAVDTRLTLATGTAEREAALDMLASLPGEQRKTVGADKNYDTEDFVSACRELNVTPHVAQNAYEYDTKTGKRAKRESRIDGRTTRHDGYRVSQVTRKLLMAFRKARGDPIFRSPHRHQSLLRLTFSHNWKIHG